MRFPDSETGAKGAEFREEGATGVPARDATRGVLGRSARVVSKGLFCFPDPMGIQGVVSPLITYRSECGVGYGFETPPFSKDSACGRAGDVDVFLEGCSSACGALHARGSP